MIDDPRQLREELVKALEEKGHDIEDMPFFYSIRKLIYDTGVKNYTFLAFSNDDRVIAIETKNKYTRMNEQLDGIINLLQINCFEISDRHRTAEEANGTWIDLADSARMSDAEMSEFGNLGSLKNPKLQAWLSIFRKDKGVEEKVPTNITWRV